MRKLFIVGGMGAGKSTVVAALAERGLPVIDLDEVGHEVLTWDVVKDDLVATFGSDVLDEQGDVIRSVVARKAFAGAAETAKLNHITMPRIEEAYRNRLERLRIQGHDAVVVEYSVFKSRENSLAHDADAIIAVVAPLEQRIARAVASGFEEGDVRRRIARQITDAERIEAADVVFDNGGSPDELRNQVLTWWDGVSR